MSVSERLSLVDEKKASVFSFEFRNQSIIAFFQQLSNRINCLDRLFLVGLKKYGKGDWRSISRNVVVTRTPTQVASHAQKYFLRQTSGKKERKRSSIHDITTADSNLVSAPVDQNWISGMGSQGQEQFPAPNQLPDQGLGGSLGYQNFGHSL
ncbi:hypothetical protein CRG98_045837 [Punica granatum]|uniref:HTH myb-type domain-containing protein n=1 Tax=Punica granatum TaxID=22663 RepID=A0A2I0HPZ9_PUNGR|nr:hypothetical protein CRG98_045837 [Punica granatum]